MEFGLGILLFALFIAYLRFGVVYTNTQEVAGSISVQTIVCMTYIHTTHALSPKG
jgi:hypothetical protein